MSIVSMVLILFVADLCESLMMAENMTVTMSVHSVNTGQMGVY